MAKKGPHAPVLVSAQVWSYGSVCGCANVWLCNCESVGGMVSVSGGKVSVFLCGCVCAPVGVCMCGPGSILKCLHAPGWSAGLYVLGCLTVLL